MFEGSRFDRCRWRGCQAECVDEIELCWYHYRLAGETFVEKRSMWYGEPWEYTKRRVKSAGAMPIPA